jgi:hypothetical protein
MRHYLVALAAALILGAPLAASAQDAPSYAQPAQDQAAVDGQIRGRVISFDGAYSVQVQDDRGFVDMVQLHPGTIINPTGITLAPGMIVSVLGYNAGSFFAANEVDTPYTYYGGVPYYGGHPWSYYGSGVSIGFFFGNTGWWHGSSFSGGYHYDGGTRVYNNFHVNNVYHGGSSYQGRVYSAPAEHGGYYPHSYPQGAYHGGGQPQGGFHGGGQPQGGGHPSGGGGGGHAEGGDHGGDHHH